MKAKVTKWHLIEVALLSPQLIKSQVTAGFQTLRATALHNGTMKSFPSPAHSPLCQESDFSNRYESVTYIQIIPDDADTELQKRLTKASDLISSQFYHHSGTKQAMPFRAGELYYVQSGQSYHWIFSVLVINPTLANLSVLELLWECSHPPS